MELVQIIMIAIKSEIYSTYKIDSFLLNILIF